MFRNRRGDFEDVCGGIGIEAGDAEADGAKEAVEHFAGFFGGGVLAAEDEFDVGVGFEWFGNGEGDGGGLAGGNGFGLVSSGN